MVARARRFLDVRRGEGLLVLLAFLDIAVVVAAFLLAKPIRNSLFLRARRLRARLRVRGGAPGADAVRPALHRIAARVGLRRVTVGTLVFFALNVIWRSGRPSAPTRSATGPPPGPADDRLAPAGGVLRVGELLRGGGAGAGVELRQLAVRHAPGEAAVRPRRGGGVASARSPAACWPGRWSGRSAAR
jgi:hypothetical protein